MPVPETRAADYPKTAKERVFSAMKEWIIDGTLKPGEKIFDKEIADYFAVSRTPVREAFQMLAEQKLITISPGKESRVTEIDPAMVRQSYEILSVLEGLAVRYAMENMTDEAIATLEDCTARMDTAIHAGDAKAANAADHLFHATILQLAGNDFLQQFCSTLETHIARTEILYFSRHDISDLLSASVKEHKMIIAAIRSGNAGEAGRFMSDNWMNTIAFIDRFL